VYGATQAYVPRPNDPYAAPGSQDLTADVNFTALTRAGGAAGLTLVHFGPERDVMGLALSAAVQSGAAEREPLAKFMGNAGFKVLVLGTRSSEAFSAPLVTPLRVEGREQDVPKAQRDRLRRVEDLLARAGATSALDESQVS
jgi:SAM-dependent MidA family methyltransferase